MDNGKVIAIALIVALLAAGATYYVLSAMGETTDNTMTIKITLYYTDGTFETYDATSQSLMSLKKTFTLINPANGKEISKATFALLAKLTWSGTLKTIDFIGSVTAYMRHDPTQRIIDLPSYNFGLYVTNIQKDVWVTVYSGTIQASAMEDICRGLASGDVYLDLSASLNVVATFMDGTSSNLSGTASGSVKMSYTPSGLESLEVKFGSYGMA